MLCQNTSEHISFSLKLFKQTYCFLSCKILEGTCTDKVHMLMLCRCRWDTFLQCMSTTMVGLNMSPYGTPQVSVHLV
jgi:hypothetical protein